MNGYKRTHYCGTLTKANAGQTVQLSGWVQRTRDLGGVVFVWLRDREGMVQLVFDDTVCDEATLKLGKSLRGEYVVTAVGEVRERAPEAVNAQMATGEIEVVVKEAELLNRSETPPIYIDDKAEENETVRLKYRYLDLRKPSMFQNAQVAARNHRHHPPLYGFAGLYRRGNADPHQVHARGRARFSGALPAAARASSTRCRSPRRSTSSY